MAIAAWVGPDTVAGAHFPGEAQSVARIDRLERSFRVVRRVWLGLVHLRFCVHLQQGAAMWTQRSLFPFLVVRRRR